MDILGYMRAAEMRIGTQDYEELDMLYELILHGWPLTIVEVQKELQTF